MYRELPITAGGPDPRIGPRGLPTWYRLRDLRIASNLVLAPMEGVTDLVFRRLIRGIGGAGYTCTEFIASEGLKRGGSSKMARMAQFDPDERPVCVQIFGRRPAVMAEAARIVEDMGASIVDINMGCPSKNVVANSGGSALMKDPLLAGQIVRAVRAAVAVPLTVKMRAGFSASQRNAPEIAHICQEEGAEALAVHWRTRADRYKGRRVVDKIAETVDAVDVPVLANGDVVDIPSAEAMLRETGAAGLMIGRGAIRNPWLMLQIGQWLRGEVPVSVDAAEKKRAMLRYFRTIAEALPRERVALGRMKMLTGHFTRGLPFGAGLRVLFLRSQTREEAEQWVHRYFDCLQAYEAGDSKAFDASPFHVPPDPGAPAQSRSQGPRQLVTLSPPP